ncbi:Gfo/Idh/MocA family protein [Hydrogenophaga intermedia]|uniref:Gfo/Idh/MocA family protein n=1 Tax=Hydrogenophaga intermedia TaxID=65786 RepID=UPI0020449765|nr:Gfo/Idh/MocA family oxidoreductase [Hydrogenophaga intermedia]MCM3562837.1 Gfo/Idh/MocA family oxidoreductase [Hydrogenophaga intermedia]
MSQLRQMSQFNSGSDRRLRVGVLGLGMAGGIMVPALASHPRTVLGGAADLNALLRQRFARDYGIAAEETAEALVARPDIDAVYIATPHQLHRDHVHLAARYGKHVIVEKPIALTLQHCDEMIESTERAGIVMMVGHTHSSDPAVSVLRDFTARGEFGRLAMVAMLNYTDFMYRPRRPEELDTAQGGGIIYNQIPHQIEVARFAANSEVRSVRASLWKLDGTRPTEGCCAAFVQFASGAAATMVYSGYDHFDSDEFHGWVSSSGRVKRPTHGATRRRLRELAAGGGEAAMRTDRYGYGGNLPTSVPTHQAHFGQMILTYERADVRTSPAGLTVYDDEGVREVSIDCSRTGRAALLDEFCAAVIDGKPPIHDGRFARGTLAACLAVLRSGETGAEVFL